MIQLNSEWGAPSLGKVKKKQLSLPSELQMMKDDKCKDRNPKKGGDGNLYPITGAEIKIKLGEKISQLR